MNVGLIVMGARCGTGALLLSWDVGRDGALRLSVALESRDGRVAIAGCDGEWRRQVTAEKYFDIRI